MKKVLSFLLVMVMTVTAMLLVVPPVEVSAATTYDLLWPVQGGKVSGYYKQGSHNGVDIYATGDDTIYAARAGKVIWCKNPCAHWDSWDSSKGVWRNEDCKKNHYATYGNVIAIQHDDGTIAIYGHLRQDGFKVSQNSRVEAGQPLAFMGSSGMSDGKHLHFELRALGSSWGSTDGAKINSNPVSKGGTVNYYYTGYSGAATITPVTIEDGIYYLNNDNYRIYMAQETQGADTIAASTETVSNKFQFNIVKDGSYYKISPTSTSKNYVLNCYWGKGGTQTSNGNEITLWENDGDLSQRWLFEECGAGYLIHPADRPDLSITRKDVKLYVEETTKSESQIWTLEPYCDHSYTYKSNSSGHWKECVQCGEKQTTSSHTYTNDCDKSCNTCGYTRTITHTYTNNCDTNCNVCGYTRTTSHTYSNSCDTSCNVCGATRTTTHSYGSYSYDNDRHWRTCTICNSSVSSQSHYYTNNCDTSCNACGYERTITHTYDNDCDIDCNVCGETRSTEHVYDNDQDTTCNVCSEVRTVETLPSSTPNETEPSTKPNTNPDANNVPSNSDKNDNNDNDDDGRDNTTTIIIVAVAGAVTVSAVSILGTALIMKKKH